jgi:hypothetical protein
VKRRYQKVPSIRSLSDLFAAFAVTFRPASADFGERSSEHPDCLLPDTSHRQLSRPTFFSSAMKRGSERRGSKTLSTLSTCIH